MSINFKVNLSIMVISIVGLVCSYFYLHNLANELQKDVFASEVVNLRNDLKSALELKKQVALTNIISIANNELIVNSLKENNRQLAIETLGNINKKFSEFTEFRNVKIHIHTKDVKSFVRNWETDKFGDDLSGFRKTILEVKKTLKPVVAFEVGRVGLTLRGIAPITDKSGEYVGSIEFIQGLGSVYNKLEAESKFYLFLMKDSATADLSKDVTKLQNYVISLDKYSKIFADDIKNTDFEKLHRENYILDDNFFITFLDVLDFESNLVGIHIIAIDKKEILKTIDNSKELITIANIISFVLIILINIAIAIIIRKFVISPIVELEDGFRGLIQSHDLSKRLQIKSKDEIAVVSNLFNEYVETIKKGIEEDTKVIIEFSEVVEKAKHGFYVYKIHTKANNPILEQLKNDLNDMLGNTLTNLDKIKQSLIEFSNSNFKHQIPLKNVSGNIGSLVAGTNALSSTLSELIATIVNTGEALQTDIRMLTHSSDILEDVSANQSKALENVAVKVENIYSSIESNASQVSQMITQAEAMKSVINIIGDIADRTNLLALNAAIEAARAGEHGRGFAVVADSVRDLAEQTQKSLTEINSNINILIQNVNDVATNFQNQKDEITEINEAMNELSKNVTENRNVSQEISNCSGILTKLANSLINVAQNIAYDEDAKDRVCNFELSLKLNKLKLDHILFKESNYIKLGNKSQWQVVNENQCNLGKWLNVQDETLKSKAMFKDLLSIHAEVHQSVQRYVNADSSGAEIETLIKLGEEIEVHTDRVFRKLDELKKEGCKIG